MILLKTGLETYPVHWILQAPQVLEIITVTNWYTDLDPFVDLNGHTLECKLVISFPPSHYISNCPQMLTCGWLNVEEGDVLLSVRLHTIDGFPKRLISIEEMWGRHNDWHIIRALQEQQAINTG